MPLFSSKDWQDDGPLGSLDAEALAERVRWAIAEAKGRDVPFPKNCRILLALRTIEDLAAGNDGKTPSRVPNPKQFIARHNTAMSFFWIMQAASTSDYPNNPFTRRKLALTARGADTDEGRDRISRNTEFELTVAARLVLGGIKVYDGEPDLRFEHGTELAGVAVKRVTSKALKQVKVALKSAVAQIDRSGLRGFVAMNLEKGLESVSPDADSEEMLLRADEVFNRFEGLGQHFFNNQRILGLILTTSYVRPFGELSPNGMPALDSNYPWRFLRLYNILELSFARDFWTRWQTTLAREMRDRLS